MNANFLALLGKKQITASDPLYRKPKTGGHKRKADGPAAASTASASAAAASASASSTASTASSAVSAAAASASAPAPASGAAAKRARTSAGYPELHPLAKSGPATGIIAIDCEMVGVGTYGERSALARCSIVNVRGECVYDKFVKPIEKVSDYRTLVSGVTAQDLQHAIPFKQAQQEIADLIKDRTLVGHGLSNDFEVLLLSHPRRLVRDTARFRGLCPHRPRALAQLAAEELGVADLHAGAHDSVTDARVALALYRKHSKQWEQMLKRRDNNHHGGDDDEKKAAAEQGSSEPAKAASGKGGKHASRSARADAEAEAPVENEFSQLLKRL